MSLFKFLSQLSTPRIPTKDMMTMSGRHAYFCPHERCWTLMENGSSGVCILCGRSDIIPVLFLVQKAKNWDWVKSKVHPQGEVKPRHQSPPRNLAYELTSLKDPKNVA